MRGSLLAKEENIKKVPVLGQGSWSGEGGLWGYRDRSMLASSNGLSSDRQGQDKAFHSSSGSRRHHQQQLPPSQSASKKCKSVCVSANHTPSPTLGMLSQDPCWSRGCFGTTWPSVQVSWPPPPPW